MRSAVVMMALALAWSVPAAAQENVSSASDTVRADASPQAPGVRSAPRAEPKRKGTFSGYIEDAAVTSKVRLRFDIGRGNESPDRAEFFYAKCGCFRTLGTNPTSGNIANHDPDAPGPFDGVVTSLDFNQMYVLGEIAFGNRFSLFGDFPYRSIHPTEFKPLNFTFPDSSGWSDIRAGFKIGLVSSDRSLVTLQTQFSMPTGDPLLGLGTNHATVEPSVLFSTEVSDRVAIEGMAGDSHPFSGSAGLPTDGTEKFSGDVFFYGIGPSFKAYRRGETSVGPVVELVGWHVLGGFASVDASGDPTIPQVRACCGALSSTGANIMNLKFGARATFASGSSLYVGWGHALTETKWYRNILRFEYRFSR